MPDGSRTWEETASARRGGDGIGLETIAKLATALVVEPAELVARAGAEVEYGLTEAYRISRTRRCNSSFLFGISCAQTRSFSRSRADVRSKRERSNFTKSMKMY